MDKNEVVEWAAHQVNWLSPPDINPAVRQQLLEGALRYAARWGIGIATVPSGRVLARDEIRAAVEGFTAGFIAGIDYALKTPRKK